MPEQVRCPRCGQGDPIQSVVALVAEDSQSPLGRMVAPPTKPSAEEPSPWVRYAGLVFIAGGVCSILSALIVIVPAISQGTFDSQLIQLSLSMVFGLGIVGGGVAALRSNAKKARKQKARLDSQTARWEVAMARWQRLYYCARDGGVFDPKEGVFVPAAQMMDYIEK